METISLLLGSRGRRDMLNKMWRSFEEKAAHPRRIECICYVDEDDGDTQKEVKFLSKNYRNFFPIYRPRIVLSEMVNECVKFARGDILWCVADDLRMDTPNYDKIVEEVYLKTPDKIFYAWGSDGHQLFGTHPIISRKWYETLGYVLPPGLAHAYSDTWLSDIANLLNRNYCLPIYNPHIHHDYGERTKDSTDIEQKIRFEKERPDLIYLNSRPKILEDTNKLRKVIEEYNESIG